MERSPVISPESIVKSPAYKTLASYRYHAIVADGNSRQIMVARVLSDEAPAKYALTVAASEGTRFGASVAVDGDTYRHQA